MNHLFDPSFQGVNRLFVLCFENENGRASHSKYYLPKVKIKDYNVKIDGENFFDFKENHKTIAINLRKQQPLDADLRSIQQINFTASQDRAGNTTMLFIIQSCFSCFTFFCSR